MKSSLHIFRYIFFVKMLPDVILNAQWLVNLFWVGWKLWPAQSLLAWPCWDQTLLVYVPTRTENNQILYQVDENAWERLGQQQQLCLILPVLPIGAHPAPISYWKLSYLGEGLSSCSSFYTACSTVTLWSVAAFLGTVIMQIRITQYFFYWLCIQLAYRWYSC